jgi:hypothetical protein
MQPYAACAVLDRDDHSLTPVLARLPEIFILDSLRYQTIVLSACHQRSLRS